MWMKGYIQACNRRSAWFSLNAHYYGQSEVNAILNQADKNILELHYTGKKERFTFKDCITRHCKSHNNLEENRRPMDKKAKIRQLLNGIRDPVLAPFKTVIHTTADLCDNFEKAVATLTTAVQEASTKSSNHYTISSVHLQTNPRDTCRGRYCGGQGGRTNNTGRRGKGGRGGRGRRRSNQFTPYGPPTSNHFYSNNEWNQL